MHRHRDASFPRSDNLMAQFFIIQSEVSDKQRERLVSEMTLRNISLENYGREMLKTFLFCEKNISPKTPTFDQVLVASRT